MTEPVGVAMIGTGRWAGHMAQAIERTDTLNLLSCFSRTRENREKYAEAFGCVAYDSFDEAIHHPDVTGVLLTTPNMIHAEQAIECARARKHVFVEKPIADTLKDANEMMEICNSIGVTLFVGHCFRRAGAARKIKQMIQEGLLGKVVLAEANWSANSQGITPDAWRYYKDQCPGGPLMQLGIHHVDTLHYLLGPVTKVQGSFAHLRTPAEIDDVGVAILEFEQGARGVITGSYVSPRTYYIRLYGSEGILEYVVDMSKWPVNKFLDTMTTVTLQRGDLRETVDFSPSDMLVDELEEFAQCIHGEAVPETGAEEGIAALKVILAALESDENGKAISL
jgi:predicted dehydrogenase